MNDIVEMPSESIKSIMQPTLNELFAALAKARGEWPDIPRTRKATVRMKNGGQYSYTYADLADVFKAIDPVLSAYGLTIMQEPVNGEIETTVAHESGQHKVFRFPIKPMQGRTLEAAPDFQSAVQVAKRYALTAHLGISTEETVEGDHNAKRGIPDGINDAFETPDGIRMPVGAKVTKDMTKRQMAEEAARAIEALFEAPKTPVGLNGVWNRNQDFINLLDERHNDLFQNLFDAFHARMATLEAGPKGEA
jgi:maltose-binding protein MalE